MTTDQQIDLAIALVVLAAWVFLLVAMWTRNIEGKLLNLISFGLFTFLPLAGLGNILSIFNPRLYIEVGRALRDISYILIKEPISNMVLSVMGVLVGLWIFKNCPPPSERKREIC